ncbi:MAG: dihydropteroate synthase [Gammaproteobacteria bacterium]|nr:dihydropteroate synthase [Gammaproteobacteria bacterium]
MIIRCANLDLDLNEPRVMGILNVTPDSFSDGGLFIKPSDALKHAVRMVGEGAAIIDVGGESTRPGAQSVSLQQELDRVIPVIEALTSQLSVPVSIDTSKPEVMREAATAGAGMINDVCALSAEGAVETASELQLPVCLMHMQGEPRSMQQQPQYDDVVADVSCFLQQRAQVCIDAGIPAQHILLDPGFGFGKKLSHNIKLLKNINVIIKLGYPVLAGISRKRMISQILDERSTDQRLYGSLAAAVIAAMKGASILRVHDVRATVDAMRITTAVMNQ